MAHIEPYFVSPEARREKFGDGLPIISEGLDSIRTYQWEVHFTLPPDLTDTLQDKLTLACKSVGNLGWSVEAIEAHRVNDKVFYPGKGSPEDFTAVFDNLYQPKIANQLWRWFTSIYNPITGKYNGNSGNFKANKAVIVQLDAQGQPLTEIRLFGVFPTAWKSAEFNYGTNDFHTIEMSFKYDFMEQTSTGKNYGHTATG